MIGNRVQRSRGCLSESPSVGPALYGSTKSGEITADYEQRDVDGRDNIYRLFCNRCTLDKSLRLIGLETGDCLIVYYPV